MSALGRCSIGRWLLPGELNGQAMLKLSQSSVAVTRSNQPYAGGSLAIDKVWLSSSFAHEYFLRHIAHLDKRGSTILLPRCAGSAGQAGQGT